LLYTEAIYEYKAENWTFSRQLRPLSNFEMNLISAKLESPVGAKIVRLPFFVFQSVTDGQTDISTVATPAFA